ncbi:hypothetical protein Q9R08_05215 [Microbacterium sp. QXD-8]|uniref:Uncharacterized protein n=1 Tax=Microbacterium psychrotolerans TaxID=3068321 RepID=A0ABU0YYG3_9MICO|nr:hypothetical protein [Microbacterium sp. QXD-8]MDQ7877373.1 hypothetical protein [Microbacterium sp. QXD-8]
MSNLSSRLQQRKMPTKDVRICLDLDLLAQRDEAMRGLAAAKSRQNDDGRMVGSPSVNNALARVTEVEDRIRDASIVIRITGVDRTKYNSFFLACPPRKARQEAFDTSKFYMHVARETGKYVDEHGETHDITSEEWADIDKVITDGEHDRIAEAVLYVNREVGGQGIDFLGDASETTRDSFGISASRGNSASPRAGSGAGSRKKSTPRTSTTPAGQ